LISTVLTIVELVLYFGFIALIAYNKPFLAQKMRRGVRHQPSENSHPPWA